MSDGLLGAIERQFWELPRPIFALVALLGFHAPAAGVVFWLYGHSGLDIYLVCAFVSLLVVVIHHD